MSAVALSKLHSHNSGGAGTKEWLARIGGTIVMASDLTAICRYSFEQTSMLSSGPLTASDIEIGRKIANQYGLTA
jgi:hypothetical protein